MVLLQAEVLRRPVVMRGDQVDAGPAPRQMVQRGREPGAEIRRVKRRGHGGDDAEPLRRLAEQRDQRHRVGLRNGDGVPQIGARRSPGRRRAPAIRPRSSCNRNTSGRGRAPGSGRCRGWSSRAPPDPTSPAASHGPSSLCRRTRRDASSCGTFRLRSWPGAGTAPPAPGAAGSVVGNPDRVPQLR